MPIAVVCTSCRQTVAALEEMAGKRAVCPNCKAVIAIPEISAPAAAPVAPTNIPTAIIATPADERQSGAFHLQEIVRRALHSEWRRPVSCMPLWFAFVLFFLPWTNLSCNGRSFAVQTGLQTAVGSASLDSRIERWTRSPRNEVAPVVRAKLDEPPPWSLLSVIHVLFVILGGALAAVCIGCVLGRIRLLSAGAQLASLGLGTAAFMALAGQMFLGFPIERHAKHQLEKIRVEHEQRADRPWDENWDLIDFEVKYSGWLWLSLLITFLSVPFFLGEFAMLVADTLKRQGQPPFNSG